MTRQSEGSGLGSALANDVGEVSVWFFYDNDELSGALTQPLDSAPGGPNTMITVKFEIDQASFPLAQVRAIMGDAQPNDDILLFDGTGNDLVPTAGQYTLMIPAGADEDDPSTKVFIESPLYDPTGEADDPIEEIRFNIVASSLDSTDPSVAPDLREGWHRRRLLIEANTTGDPASPGPVGGGVCNTFCAAGCDNFVEGPATQLHVQVGHATPWTTRDPIVGVCPGSGVSDHCQESIKVRNEGGNGETPLLHMGYRFKQQDNQGPKYFACGCDLLTSADKLTIRFHVSGSATPTDTPGALSADDDYTLRYIMPNRSYDIPVPNYVPSGVTVDVVIEKDDYGNGADCFTGKTPPGFGLFLEMNPNDDGVGVLHEEAVLRMQNAPQPPWIGDNMQDNFSVGWNSTARFIIEEGS